MGMFDYVRCEYPLPDGGNNMVFQTKDTFEQYLGTYVITEDGRLVNPDGDDEEFHGDLNFYASNWAGYCPLPKGSAHRTAMMTGDDAPFRGYDYTARFTDGRITKITGGSYGLEPHIKHVTHEEWYQIFAAGRAARRAK